MSKTQTSILRTIGKRILTFDFLTKQFGYIFLISTFLWFLSRFSASYTETINFNFVLHDLPKQYSLLSDAEQQASFKVMASGFQLLRIKMASKDPIPISAQNLDYTTTQIRHNLTQNQQDFLPKWLLKQNILSIHPQEFRFKIDKLVSRKIAIQSELTLQPNSGFAIRSIQFDRDSIDVFLPSSFVDSINVIKTEVKTFKNIDKSKRIKVLLDIPQHVKLDSTSRHISIYLEVNQLTEGQISVEINKPFEHINYFPSKVKLSYSVPTQDYSNIKASDFLIEAQSIPGQNTFAKVVV
ncbi:MAG: hypothetical protein ACPGEC_06550, partial [Flavobacteriales bacterium]